MSDFPISLDKKKINYNVQPTCKMCGFNIQPTCKMCGCGFNHCNGNIICISHSY